MTLPAAWLPLSGAVTGVVTNRTTGKAQAGGLDSAKVDKPLKFCGECGKLMKAVSA